MKIFDYLKNVDFIVSNDILDICVWEMFGKMFRKYFDGKKYFIDC